MAKKKPRRWISLTLERQPSGAWAADVVVDGRLEASFNAKLAKQLVPLITKTLLEHMLGKEPPKDMLAYENKGQGHRVEHTPEGA